MSSLNKVQIIGNLGADPEVATLPSGSNVANIRVAVSDKYTGKDGAKKETTEWFTVKAYDKLGDLCAKYLKKGSKVYLEGRLQTREFVNKDGAKQRITEVIAREVQFLDPKPQGQQASATPATDDDMPF